MIEGQKWGDRRAGTAAIVQAAKKELPDQERSFDAGLYRPLAEVTEVTEVLPLATAYEYAIPL